MRNVRRVDGEHGEGGYDLCRGKTRIASVVTAIIVAVITVVIRVIIQTIRAIIEAEIFL